MAVGRDFGSILKDLVLIFDGFLKDFRKALGLQTLSDKVQKTFKNWTCTYTYTWEVGCCENLVDGIKEYIYMYIYIYIYICIYMYIYIYIYMYIYIYIYTFTYTYTCTYTYTFTFKYTYTYTCTFTYTYT